MDNVSASTTALAGSMTSLDSDQNLPGLPPTISRSDSFHEDLADGPNSDAPAGRNCTVGSSGPTEDASQELNRLQSKAIPTNPVLGIQSEESERAMPLFHIKPVNQEGVGLKGPEGERLEDKGDVPLDLSGRKFISMDWRNNDKLTSYVLVQSKELVSSTYLILVWGLCVGKVECYPLHWANNSNNSYHIQTLSGVCG